MVGADGFPASTPLHPTTGLKDAALTQAANPDGSCLVRPGQPTPPAGTVCGDWSVNTIQPTFQPFAPGTPDANRLPPQTYPNIGTRLSAADVSWAWYSGGWDNANGNVRRARLDQRQHAGHLHRPAARSPPRSTRTARTRCSSSTTSR